MKIIITLLAVILFCTGCANLEPNPDVEYTYRQPVDKNDGLAVSNLQAQSMDENRLTQLIRDINDGQFPNLEGITIFRNGFLVLEEYFYYISGQGQQVDYHWNKNKPSMASCTKSITSVLAGIALKLGLLKDSGEKLYDYFPNYHHLDWENGKKDITISDMLNMRAGMYWDEWSYPYSDPRNTHNQLNNSADIIQYSLGLEMVNQPGTLFNYNSALPILLGAIIKKVSGMEVDEFARIHLFEPLGIENYNWYTFHDGTVHTGGGLTLSPRDMGKIGLLYLNKGEWNGQKIIDPSWINETMRFKSTGTPGLQYAYYWWASTFSNGNTSQDAFYADGYGHQYILCLPGLNLVCAIIGTNYTYDGSTPVNRRILERYILPATR